MLKPKVRISRLTQTLDALAEWLNTIYVAVDDKDGNTMKVPLTDFVKSSDFTSQNAEVSNALSQINESISTINSAISSIENELDEKADVSALNTQVTTLGNSITTLTQQLSQLNTELGGRVTQVEYDVGIIKNQIPLLVGFHVITNALITEGGLSRDVEEGELAWYFNEDAGQIELYEALKDIAKDTLWNPSDWKAVDINEMLKEKATLSQLEESNRLLDSMKINKDQIAPFEDADDTSLGEVFIDRADGKLKKCIVDEPGEHAVANTSVAQLINDTNAQITTKVSAEAQARGYEDELLRQSIPTKTSQLDNDSGFVASTNITNIVKCTELPSTQDPNTLYIVVESA